KVVSVTGVGFLGPFMQAGNFAAKIRCGTDRQSVDIILRVASAHLVDAEVVAPALEKRGACPRPERGFKRVDDGREVLAEDLTLKGESGGADDDALVMSDCACDCGHKIGDGLARTGASLDEQVL